MSDDNIEYQCLDESQGPTCATNCTSLESCQDCGCVTLQTDVGGPWGEVMDVFFCLLPIFFLVYATIKPKPMSTTASLPLAALFMFLIRLMYLGSDPLLTSGAVILGIHEAVTPLSIMAGAITLFESMEASYCLPYMMREMKDLTAGHPVAELMLIFCFAYLVEGASGFGTPVALGAPMLVSTGHAPFPAVVVLLIMNTFATVWGAVGTPIWFGFGGLGLTEDEFLEISAKASIPLAVSCFILIPMSLMLLVPRSIVLANWKFVLCSLITCIGPSVGIAHVSYSFPSLMGGLVGCIFTSVLVKYKVGLVPLTEQQEQAFVALQQGKNEEENDDVGTQKKDPDQQQVTASSSSVVGVGIVTPGDVVVVEKDMDNKVVKNGTKSMSTEPPEDSPIEMMAPDEQQTGGSQKQAAEAADEMDHDDDPEDSSRRQDNNENDNDAANRGDDVMGPFVQKETPSLSNSKPIGSSIQDAIVDDHLGPRKSWSEGYLRELIIRTFPIWGVVLILILTRVEQIGIKYYLTLREPYFSIYFGTYGTFRLSVSIVFQLLNILTYPGLSFKYELLYVPFLIPFVLVSLITLFIYRRDLAQSPKQIAKTVTGRLTTPAIALFGALSLVQLLIRNGEAAPANILGTILSKWFKQGFIVLSPLLGALGSFFSGSTTVSNLTFGDVQKIAAESINTSLTAMLALQAVGGSAGNGICLNNIIAACAVVGLDVGEGKILLQTYKFVFASTTIATLVMLAFYFRFD